MEQVTAVVVGDGCGLEAIPDDVQHEAASDGQKWRAKHESERVDGDVVAHECEEKQPRQTKATQEIDRIRVVAAAGRKPEGDEEKRGEQSEGAESFEQPAESVRVGADEGELRGGVVDTIDDGVKPKGGRDVEFESGAKGDGGELISKEGGVNKDVVGLDGKEGEHIGDQVECGEADGVAVAEIDR